MFLPHLNIKYCRNIREPLGLATALFRSVNVIVKGIVLQRGCYGGCPSLFLINFTYYFLLIPLHLLDLAQHYLVKNGITAIRRIRKTDNNRIARACGATIVNRTEELKEGDVGTAAGLFEIKKFGDE